MKTRDEPKRSIRPGMVREDGTTAGHAIFCGISTFTD